MLYYLDNDAKTFNVVGPVSDDDAVRKSTVALQEKGRKVRIFTSSPETDIKKLPSIQQCVMWGIAGYKYDPKVKW
jgi:hypothetical protein